MTALRIKILLYLTTFLRKNLHISDFFCNFAANFKTIKVMCVIENEFSGQRLTFETANEAMLWIVSNCPKFNSGTPQYTGWNFIVEVC